MVESFISNIIMADDERIVSSNSNSRSSSSSWSRINNKQPQPTDRQKEDYHLRGQLSTYAGSCGRSGGGGVGGVDEAGVGGGGGGWLQSYARIPGQAWENIR